MLEGGGAGSGDEFVKVPDGTLVQQFNEAGGRAEEKYQCLLPPFSIQATRPPHTQTPTLGYKYTPYREDRIFVSMSQNRSLILPEAWPTAVDISWCGGVQGGRWRPFFREFFVPVCGQDTGVHHT